MHKSVDNPVNILWTTCGQHLIGCGVLDNLALIHKLSTGKMRLSTALSTQEIASRTQKIRLSTVSTGPTATITRYI